MLLRLALTPNITDDDSNFLVPLLPPSRTGDTGMYHHICLCSGGASMHSLLCARHATKPHCPQMQDLKGDWNLRITEEGGGACLAGKHPDPSPSVLMANTLTGQEGILNRVLYTKGFMVWFAIGLIVNVLTGQGFNGLVLGCFLSLTTKQLLTRYFFRGAGTAKASL